MSSFKKLSNFHDLFQKYGISKEQAQEKWAKMIREIIRELKCEADLDKI